MILILSNKLDLCVDFVIRNLRQKNERFVRLNTEDLPTHGVTISSPNFEYILHDETGQHRLSEVRSVWFRRPGRLFEDCGPESRPSLPVLRFVQDQWDSVIEGLRSQPNVLWINDPAKNRDAECKISQLRIAVQIGLPIPRTCITSNKESAAAFLRECDGRVVAKALYSPLIEYVEKDYFVFTSEATQLDEVTANELRIAPTIFQELLAPKTDYRVTVVGKEHFACKIESTDGTKVPTDWRTKKDGITFVPCSLPSEVSKKCIDLVSRFGLIFGAIDLAQVGDKFFFFELNPNGEWGWLQETFPIAEALTERLIHGVEFES